MIDFNIILILTTDILLYHYLFIFFKTKIPQMKNQNCFPVVFILAIIIIFLFQSCASTDKVTNSGIIQKRKYTKGFYVNIIRNKIKINKNLKIERQVLNDNCIVEEKYNVLECSFEDYNKETDTNSVYLVTSTKVIPVILQKNKLPLISTLSKPQKPSKNIVKRIFTKSKQKATAKSLIDQPNEDPKLNKIAMFGFVCSLLALTGIIVSAVFSIFAAIYSFFFIIPAIICCSIGIFQINRRKGKEKGKAFAVIGLIIGIVLYLCAFGLIFLFMAANKVDLFSGTM
jgi:hypothetical protein